MSCLPTRLVECTVIYTFNFSSAVGVHCCNILLHMQACNELIFEQTQFAEKLCAQFISCTSAPKGTVSLDSNSRSVLLHTTDSLYFAVHFAMAIVAGNVPQNIVETPLLAYSVLYECTKS